MGWGHRRIMTRRHVIEGWSDRYIPEQALTLDERGDGHLGVCFLCGYAIVGWDMVTEIDGRIGHVACARQSYGG